MAAKSNEAKLSIKRISRTGLIKGTFAVFTQNGTRLKKTTVVFNGAIVGGEGYGSAVIKKTGSVKVFLTGVR